MACLWNGWSAAAAVCLAASTALAQPTPPTAEYPAPATPPPAPPAPADAPPSAAPPPAAPDYGPQPAAPPGPPGPAEPPPPAGYAPPPPPPGYASPPPPGYGYDPNYVPPPPVNPERSFRMPTFSVRLDPLRWLIYGEVGLEAEVELWEFLSLELVPVFVVNDQPPAMNDFDGVLSQHSNGIGALAGTSVGLGFWLDGEPMRGTVIRAILTNYGYTYRTEDDAGLIDEVSHTDRHVYGFIGSYRRWGFFTFGGGFGVGVELNERRRCFTDADVGSTTSDCSDEQLRIALDRQVRKTAGLNSSIHPVQIMGRISLGVVF